MPGTLVRARSQRRAASRPAAPSATPEAVSARVDADAVTVTLADGRTVSVPLAWSARLLHATPAERADVETDPFGLYWPQINETWSVDGMLAGWSARESSESFAVWRALMDRRRAQIARGDEPEPHFPTLALPDWWDAEEADDAGTPVPAR